MIFLPQPPKCWDYRRIPPCLAIHLICLLKGREGWVSKNLAPSCSAPAVCGLGYNCRL
jgi:hypothetical protein